MRTPALIFISCFLAFTACKKKQAATAVADEPAATPNNSTELVCAAIPPAPSNFGWHDTTAIGDDNINAFFYNPLNHDEIIYVANGDEFGYNKMFVYNIPARQTTYLSNNGDNLPQVNSKGWIVFSRDDYNIYKIKTTGDSLTQLTFNNISHDAKWDYTGTNIYFYQTASGSLPNVLAEMDVRGGIVNTIPTELANTAMARTGNRMAYLKTSSSTISVYYKDLAANSETLIISTPGTSATFSNIFQNLTFDNKDENLYWCNDGGVFKCNLASPKIDTLIKNCANIIYTRILISKNEDKMTLGRHTIEPISSTKLLHKYRAFEMDLNSRQLNEVRVFP